MKRIFILALLAIFTPLLCFGEQLQLVHMMQEATPGSYLVTFQDKNFTLVHIYEKNDHYLTLEEVSIPASRVSKEGMNWRHWFEMGGGGHTSWTMSRLNLHTGHFEAAYSFTKRGWVDTKEADHYMSTLLNLTFYSIPNDYRRKIGPPPGYGKQDKRPIWHPRLVVDGTILSGVTFRGWKTRWPNDRSDLSKKKIEVYLPEIVEGGAYPIFFPYWIEVEGKLASGRLRVIDSGQGVHSPMPPMPGAPITLLKEPSLTPEGLTLSIESPSYYGSFILLAEETNSPFGRSTLLPHTATLQDNGEILLFVSTEALERWIDPHEKYRFVISPRENQTIFIETSIPFSCSRKTA